MTVTDAFINTLYAPPWILATACILLATPALVLAARRIRRSA